MNHKILATALALLALLTASCKEDWTIKDVPVIPEKAVGPGYVAGFEEDGSLIIPVEVAADGNYTVTVTGRASEDGTTGTGTVSCGGADADISFAKAGSWSTCDVTLPLKKGANDVVISKGGGNGLFHVDFIDVKN